MVIDWWIIAHVASGFFLRKCLKLGYCFILLLLVLWELFTLWGHSESWTWGVHGWWEHESVLNRWGIDIISGLLGAALAR